jgi:hypothetical protein
MKQFAAEWIRQLNAQHSGGVFFLAAVLAFPGDTRYVADVQHPIVFNGNTYTPLPLQLEGVEQTTQQTLPTVRLRTANVHGIIGQFLETTSILGVDVTVQLLHLDLLGAVANQDSLQLQIMAAEWDDQVATVHLGLNLGLQETLPRHLITAAEFPGVPEGYRRGSVL